MIRVRIPILRDLLYPQKNNKEAFPIQGHLLTPCTL